MGTIQALFLAILQGITEFLPISSSGHLVLFQKLFKIATPPVFFDILLHFGTLGSVVVFFRKEITNFFFKKDKKLFSFLIIGSLPVAIFGFFLKDKIDEIFNSLQLLGIMWTLCGLSLVFSSKIKPQDLTKETTQITWQDSLIIGLFQALAVFPGVSRSGTTILGGMIRKFKYSSVLFLSFFLSIPAIFGSLIFELSRNKFDGTNFSLAIFSAFVAGLVGYFSLKTLQNILKSNKLKIFGFYCLILGSAVIIKSIF